MSTPSPRKDKDIQQFIGTLLRLGVVISCLVAIAGGIIYLYLHGAGKPEYHIFKGAAQPMRSLNGIIQSASQDHGRGIIQLGVVILIATPILRVFFSGLAFMLEKDYLYTFISLLVLAIILFSMFEKLGG